MQGAPGTASHTQMPRGDAAEAFGLGGNAGPGDHAESAISRVVSRARGLYVTLVQRRLLDAEQRHTGAAGLTPPERDHLEAHIRQARARLAQLGQPAPQVPPN
jgi:hypothetical protein